MDDKGEWNGVVRKLIDKQADIGLGSMSVMAERETGEIVTKNSIRSIDYVF